jgi:hypothetical protein
MPGKRVSRIVTLRTECIGPDWRNLEAYLDEAGNLHIDGQDLGPATAPVSGDGEYEWFQIISVTELPRLLELIDVAPGQDVLNLLERKWTGPNSHELEKRLRESDIPIVCHVWSG